MRSSVVLVFGVAFAHQRGEALGETQKGDETDQEYGVGEGDSGELGCADVAYHYVVRQLHDHLACLGYHHRKGHFHISLIEW